MATRILRAALPNALPLAFIAAGALVLYRSRGVLLPAWEAFAARSSYAPSLAALAAAGVLALVVGAAAGGSTGGTRVDPVRSAAVRPPNQAEPVRAREPAVPERTRIGPTSAAEVAARRPAKAGGRLAGLHFERRSIGLAHGDSSAGKSRWLAEIARAVTRGDDVFGWPTEQAAVVWVTEESLNVWAGKGRLIARPEELRWPWWKHKLRERFPQRFAPTCWPVSLRDRGAPPTLAELPGYLATIEHLARRVGAGLVIGDTVAALCPEAMTSNTNARLFMGLWANLAQRLEAAVELVHHDNDAGNPLGPKQIKAQADYTHHVQRLPNAPENDTRRLVVFGKRYEPFAPPPLRYRMRDDGRLEALAAPATQTAASSAPPPTPPTPAVEPDPALAPPADAAPIRPAPAVQVTPEQAAILAALDTLPRLYDAPGVPFMVLQRALNVPKATLHGRLKALALAGRVAATERKGVSYWHRRADSARRSAGNDPPPPDRAPTRS